MSDKPGVWIRRYDKKLGWMIECPHYGAEFFECDEQCIRFDYCPHCGHPMKHEYQAAIGGRAK